MTETAALNPRAVAAMRARGYDLTTHTSKGLETVDSGPWDYLVTMGCGDACPWVRAHHREDWALPDPRGLPEAEFEAVRDEIERRVLDLIGRIRASRQMEGGS